MTGEFARFVAAGAFAALANFLARIAFSTFMGLELAVVLAYCVGMAVAFALMRTKVFPRSEAPLPRQGAIFVAVNIIAVLQTLVVTLVLARWLLPTIGVNRWIEEIAHGVGILVPVITSYFGHKHLSFRRG